MVRVKICGIRSASAAVAAAEAGADAIGLVFAPGRRQVTVDQARAIVAALPPFVTRVGVFVDEDPARIREVAASVPLDLVQLHGSESPRYCAALGLPVIKAVRMRDRTSGAALGEYRVAGFLLDSFEPNLAGGTGKPFPWALAAGLRAPAPLILAGGLTAENVGEALEIVRPYGVDVSSGVETDGRKDPAKIREFIRRVRLWDDAR
ncbi:MAG: phosphoribosylanthranilate isomerase [Armatimonadota bacterium]|nr:phosphoribosylanthranilate isomerase [Armatimonadota bacterium]MDR7451029.1 phosphoribosylanthranilate isomerase [Armatimonadota bacterium]MDR7465950.1 phosphoribosylanthranilate isomerase [Armatimonadota bacterium]MDR7494015.1 phosphoribosylanthranilate isomerase [Armatimonadota bacterium]MDR7498465.1 phosphoribosylanthranilate isomerase [Armatimonadota bacterium]